MTELYSIKTAAQALHLSRQRVHQLVTAGRLHAVKVGWSYVITITDLESFRTSRPNGHISTLDKDLEVW